jgi:hypothetical protein
MMRSAMALRTCTVSFTGPTGVRHSVQVTAETLYEAAITGLHLLRQEQWGDNIAPGTPVTMAVANPSNAHTVNVAQLCAWAEGLPVVGTPPLTRSFP